MSPYETASLSVQQLTLGILTLTFLAAAVYAWLTWQLWRTAAEQSEAQQRPALVLVRLPEVGENQDLEEMIMDELPARILFRNVGKGPALNCEFRVTNRTTGETVFGQAFTYVPVGKGVQSNWKSPQAIPAEALLTIEYESLTGRGYTTEVPIDSKKVGRTRFRIRKK